MNRGEDSGPCPLCKAPTKVVEYDETPWGARGNYIFSCEKCGEFRDVIKDPSDPTPVWYIFQDPASQLRYRVANSTDEELRVFWGRLRNIPDDEIPFSDEACPAPVDLVAQGFVPGEVVRNLRTIKPRLCTLDVIMLDVEPPPSSVVYTNIEVDFITLAELIAPTEPAVEELKLAEFPKKDDPK